ncbi:RNase A-like domain-containing protein [Paraburkholderia sp. BR13439]|uniref:RNase A-like domain-containing protein n=1 Tax=Paraburkholderia TaxID=1822464 RepID=UPI0034CF4A0B
MSYQHDSDGVRVVLSAPQLAAVLSRQSINPTEMLSNRLWGGLQVVGGVLEMVGAAALCVLPEPHVAKDEAWLRERLRREPQKRVVSSFRSLRVAVLAISDVMNSNIFRIQSWAKSPRNRIPLTLVKKVPGDIGYGITRKTNELTKMNEVTVVLKF